MLALTWMYYMKRYTNIRSMSITVNNNSIQHDKLLLIAKEAPLQTETISTYFQRLNYDFFQEIKEIVKYLLL